MACTPSTDSAGLFEQYIAAVNAHDLDRLAAMTAENAVWGHRVGRDALMDQSRFDVAMDIQLLARDIVARGDTVEATLTERTLSHWAYELDSTLHYVRFVFRDGQMASKGRTQPDPMTPAEFQTAAQLFRDWTQRTYPEARDGLLQAPGVMRINAETGALMARLLREWVAAGRP